MNKKVNTLFFVLGATVACVIAMLVVYFGPVFALLRFALPSEILATILIVVWFPITLVIVFLIYNRVMRSLYKRIDMDKYFDPIVRPGKAKPRPPAES